MSGGAFILAINLSVAGLFGAAFLAAAVYDGARVSARWLAAGFAFGMLNFLLEFAIAAFGSNLALLVGAYAAFLAALVSLNAGIAHLYGQRPPWAVLGALLVAAVALRFSIEGMERDSVLRMFLYQAPYAVIQAVGIVIVLRSSRRDAMTRMLTVLLSLSALHYLAKPFVAAASGGMGASPQDYAGTAYALFSQASGTVFGVAVALLILVILVTDIFADITEQSLTDKLSGLLNRRGFEAGLEESLRRAAGIGLPVSLVICDLDRFKAINDTYGHAAGDRVIEAFSQLLRECLADHRSAARIGGEEFAALLPGSDLFTARLFAENVRSAFAMQTVEELPETTRLTASFGVAQLAPGEMAFEFQERADNALYEAKRNGRDRVEISLSATVPRATRAAGA